MLMQQYCLILLICALTFYLLILFNAKSIWLNATLQEHSMLSSRAKFNILEINLINKYFFKFGQFFAKFFSKSFLEKQEFIYKFILRDFSEFYINLARCALIFCAFIFLSFVYRNLLFVLLALLFTTLLFYETEISYKAALKQVENSIKHVTQCLEILLVRTETPIINALEIISSGLDTKFKYCRLELRKIISKAQKAGLEAALVDYNSDTGPNIKEFISMLISVSDGASKKATQEQINKFLQTEREREEECQKSLAENLQLYLMFPVIFMLLILMLPMADAISYALQNTGFVGGTMSINS